MDTETLSKMLASHSQWLAGTGGERANLRDANLSYANLSDANLSDANLSGADLRDANLRDANLSDANLSYANLSDANLSDANLRDANLSYATLPDRIVTFGPIGTVNQMSTFYPKFNRVWSGCWQGSLEEFRDKIAEKFEPKTEIREFFDAGLILFEEAREQHEKTNQPQP